MDGQENPGRLISEDIAADETHFNEDQHDIPDPVNKDVNQKKEDKPPQVGNELVQKMSAPPILPEQKSLAGLQLEQLQRIAKAIEVLGGSKANIVMLDNIRDFHEHFGLAYDGPPRQLPVRLRQFRIDFLKEELDEYCRASVKDNLVEMLDALVDLCYVLIGTAYQHGFRGFPEAWDRVHKANMTKVRTNKGSVRGGMYDVVKPEGWKHPELRDLVS